MPSAARIVLSPRLQALRVETQERAHRGLGDRLTEIVIRYDLLMGHYNPRGLFDDEQWALLTAVIYEKWPESDLAATSPTHIAEILLQANLPGLAAEVRALSLVETMALIEAVYADLLREPQEEPDA